MMLVELKVASQRDVANVKKRVRTANSVQPQASGSDFSFSYFPNMASFSLLRP